MKLSHRDFRPQRRSRFVTRPPHRRPTLRILFLALLGLAVYLKFDTVAKAVQGFQPQRWWESFRAPAPIAAKPGPDLALSWSADSLSVLIACAALPDSCLGPGFPLGPEAAGRARGLIRKAGLQSGLAIAPGLRAGFRKEPGAETGPGWQVERLELTGPGSGLALTRAGGDPLAPLCAAAFCLDAATPKAPIAGNRPSETGPGDPGFARFVPGRGAAVQPILPGRVAALPDSADPESWLRLHHGGDRYTCYRGFARLSSGLRPDAKVESGDTLGWIAADSLAGLDVRVEARGAAVDVAGFLGLADAPAEVAHAR